MSLTRPVLQALAAAVVVFIAFEAAEWLWWHEAEMRTLHLLHRGREFLAAVTAAVVAGRSAFQQSSSLLAIPLAAPDVVHGPRAGVQHDAYVHWFILMRWIAVVVAALLVFVTVQVVGWLPQSVWYPLLGIIAALALLNIAYTALLQWGADYRKLLISQAYLDLMFLTLLLHYSGGIENPLGLVMIFHVIIAGIVLSQRQCFAVAGAATLLFAVLAGAELTHVVDHYTLQVFPHVEEGGHVAHAAHMPLFVGSYVSLQGGILFLTAVFVTSLVDRLRHDEQKLEEMAATALTQRQMLERALETTGTGLCVRDVDLRPAVINQDVDARRGSGLVGSELPWPLADADVPARQTLADGGVRVTETTSPHAAEAESNCQEQERRTIQVTTAPLHNKSGRVTHVVQLLSDITEQKASQARMLRAGQLAAVGELAGQVAHEVNNPIGIISAKSRLLLANQRDGMSAKAREELGKIVQLADRIAHVAQGLLSYSRPSPEQRVRLDVAACMRRAFAMVEQRADKQRVYVDDHLPQQLPLVRANSQEMEQVFLNLLMNALDAMPDGGRLTLSAREIPGASDGSADRIAFEVTDTGGGIPEKIRGLVLEPFFTTKPPGKGTGLGLSICRGIVESCSGTIEIDSAGGKGTTISVIFPADDTNTRGA